MPAATVRKRDRTAVAEALAQVRTTMAIARAWARFSSG